MNIRVYFHAGGIGQSRETLMNNDACTSCVQCTPFVRLDRRPDDSRVCLLLGRRVDVDREVMDVIDRCIMKEMVMWWQRRKVLLGWVN